MALTDSGLKWWHEKWWLEEEYARIYKDKINPAEIDRAICRVAEVFDSDWASRTPHHPIYAWVLAKGLMPLQALYSLGKDLLTLDGSLRFASVIDDLRQPSNYGSARLETGIAARLKQQGHNIEFRPPLPNGKQADFLAELSGQRVYFEIKALQESQTQLALNRLVQSVAFALSDLTRDSNHPLIKGRKYKTDLDGGLANLLGAGQESDKAIIESIAGKIVGEITARAEQGQPLEFVIPFVARILIGEPGQEGSEVTCTMAASEAELKRIIRGAFRDGIEQMHPEEPGIIIIQTPGTLDFELTQVVVDGLLSGLGARVSSVSAVFFLSVFHWLPPMWCHFKPFVVHNRFARSPAHDLKAFADLEPLFQPEVRTPSGR